MARVPNRRKLAFEALDQADWPIYVLDKSGRILYCNPACQDWLSVADEQVVGQVVVYGGDPWDAPPPWAGLCPPPEAFAGREVEGLVWKTSTQGSLLRHRALFVQLATSDTATAALLVKVGDRLSDEGAGEHDVPLADAALLHEQLIRYTTSVDSFLRIDPLVGVSPSIKQARAQVRLAACVADRVLIVGPVGAGQEVVARSIHDVRRGQDHSRLFPLECSLLDAELLRTAIQAFVRRRVDGADPGAATLLLLDVDQLAADAQQTLLDLIEDSTLRTLATAAGDLSRMADFRPELAAALSTLTIRLPPLAERPEDLPLLIQNAVERDNRPGGRQLQGVTSQALDQLVNHPWRGNLDELIEVLRQARERSVSTFLSVADLPERLRLTAEAERFPTRRAEPIELDAYLASIERELIQRALRVAKGNRAEAARLLGIPRARLLRRLEVYGF